MLFAGVGTQLAAGVEVVCVAVEEIADDAREEAEADVEDGAWEDTTVTDETGLVDDVLMDDELVDNEVDPGGG